MRSWPAAPFWGQISYLPIRFAFALESGTVENVPLETSRCLQGALISMMSLHGLAKLFPAPMQKAASPAAPQQERGRRVKEAGVPVTLLGNP
jgi:hypothetical protein